MLADITAALGQYYKKGGALILIAKTRGISAKVSMKKFIAALMTAGFILAGAGSFTAYASDSLREFEYQRKKQAES